MVHRTAVIFQITSVTILYTPSVPAPFLNITGFLSTVIMNVMASRIYRNTCNALGPTNTPLTSFAEKCNRKHVEEISLNQIISGRNCDQLKIHGEFPKSTGEQNA